MNRSVILIEGPIGAGKTSLAMQMAEDLEAKGGEARAYLEFDPDHPIRTAHVDQLLGRVPDPKAYGPQAWARLAAQAIVNRQTILLDGCLIQNTLLPAFAAGGHEDALLRLAQERLSALAPLKPLLVYLRVSDLDQHVGRLHDARAGVWADDNVTWINGTAWAQAEGKSGLDAVIGFHQAWQHWIDGVWTKLAPAGLVIDAHSLGISEMSRTVLAHADKPS